MTAADEMAGTDCAALTGLTVWVAETWGAHGGGFVVFGVFTCREAAFGGLKTLPGMTVYVDDQGNIQGRPKRERGPVDRLPPLFGEPGHQRAPYIPEKWATARPRVIQGRRNAAEGTHGQI